MTSNSTAANSMFRLGILVVVAAWISSDAAPCHAGSVRFHGYGAADLDRVKIRIDDVNDLNDEPGPPVDVGATDFTIEFWMRGVLAENATGTQECGNEGWIYGHVILDRDRWEPGGRDFGISVGEGRMSFGCANPIAAHTVCGSSMVLDGSWHHIAVDHRVIDGRMRLFIDGVLEASEDGPDGDVSYPGNEVPQGSNCQGGPCVDSDPFVVFGAEKHDAGSPFPSYSGWLDEVRFSKVLRYAGNFVPSSSPFVSDASTSALYHFDEGSGDVIGDASGAAGGPSDGMRRFGGSPVPGPEWSTETPFSPATAVSTGPSERTTPLVPAPAVLLEAHPNPSLGETLVFVRTQNLSQESFELRLMDVGGREVRQLGGRLDRGSALLIWDGRNAAGEIVPEGVYFAKVALPAGEASAKIIVR